MDFAISLLQLELLSNAPAQEIDYQRRQNVQEQHVNAVHERRPIHVERQIVDGI